MHKPSHFPNTLRIGIVPYLNALPFKMALARYKHSNSTLIITEETPAILYEMLMEKQLDVALISSVQYLRHKNILSYYPHLGICTKNQASSVLYFRKKETENQKVTKVWADKSSKTSIALLQVLFYKKYGFLPKIEAINPNEIFVKIQKGKEEAGLLIGDAALELYKNTELHKNISFTDLGEWWSKEEKLPFVFALWAYHSTTQIDWRFLQQAAIKLSHNIEEITHQNTGTVRKYLTENIYYDLGQVEKQAIQRFEELLHEYSLI